VDDKDHKKSRKRAKPAKVIGDDQSDDDAKDEGATTMIPATRKSCAARLTASPAKV